MPRRVASPLWVSEFFHGSTGETEPHCTSPGDSRESAKNLPANVSFVLVPFKALDLLWIASALSTGQIRFTYAPVKSFLRVDKEKVQIYNPAFFKYIHDRWTEHHGRYPSTGMLVLFFALHVCDETEASCCRGDGRKNREWRSSPGSVLSSGPGCPVFPVPPELCDPAAVGSPRPRCPSPPPTRGSPGPRRGVNVYGFGADSRGNWHHYWENNRYAGEFRKTGVHDADFEAHIIDMLAKASKIEVYRGN
ncbi:hypothetical protein GH733_012947 [Mirounga leonina]|nr:hypothetical protein GH733_012947 [Mirounga leonina]